MKARTQVSSFPTAPTNFSGAYGLGEAGTPLQTLPLGPPPCPCPLESPRFREHSPSPLLVSVNLRPKRMPLPAQRGGGAWLGAQRAEGPVPLYVLSTPALWMSSACRPVVGQSARVPC